MKNNQTAKLLAARILLLVNGIIWLFLAAGAVFRMNGNSSEHLVVGTAIVILMIGNAAVMVFCAFVAKRREKLIYYFTLSFLAANIILTFTDQFGFWDLITLVIDVVIMALLVFGRKKYQHAL